jgi:DNA-binding CsgD family transcriptional regulator
MTSARPVDHGAIPRLRVASTGETLELALSARGRMVAMHDLAHRRRRALAALLVLGVVVVLVVFGFARGVWASNLHNGLLALAFTAVGAYVLAQRARYRIGTLFVATGAVEGVMFFGRQAGHAPAASADRWWAWLGVWPLALALALTTLTVLCFPDGRLPSPGWRPVAAAMFAVAVVTASLSALWPVEYESAGVLTTHPIHAQAPAAIADLWGAVTHPAYVAFQLLWIVALAYRWRVGDRAMRSQLSVLAFAAGGSLAALGVGLVVWGTHVPGVLAATLVPVAAGWAVVSGQRLTHYRALSWLSRTSADAAELPSELAKITAEALSASSAALWMGDGQRLQAVGLWPDTDVAIPAATLVALHAGPDRCIRTVTRNGQVIGALTVEVGDARPLTRTEEQLLDDVAGQAAWIIEHLTLSHVVEAHRQAGHLKDLTSRERQVLDLMARGLTNRAICDELFLSIKTVEPIVGAIFAKLDLQPDAASNRRVLAVLAYLRRR